MTPSTLRPTRVRAVLFDLDGTLLDTAPDMGAAINALLHEESLPPLSAERIRPHVSHGSNGLVRLAFGDADPIAFESRRQRFLTLYAACLTQGTRPFAGMLELLRVLEVAGIAWGVVTNKPGWLTDPLLAHLALAERAACVVSGDTLPQRKPHPAPLLHAARQLAVDPADCVYVGDAERDVTSASAAGMHAVVARYGYLGDHDDLTSWPTHASIEAPLDLLTLLGLEARVRAHA